MNAEKETDRNDHGLDENASGKVDYTFSNKGWNFNCLCQLEGEEYVGLTVLESAYHSVVKYKWLSGECLKVLNCTEACY